MWRPDDGDEEVVCPACGRSVSRSDAREYDKYGDRWNRADKAFEHFCKPCHAALSKQRRDDLEDLLLEVRAGCCSDGEFLRRYAAAVEERYGSVGER